MRLDQHRVAGRQGGEQARIAVPRREGVAADHQGDAARHGREALAQLQRIALALRLGPRCLLRGADLLGVRIRHRLQAAVLGMRPARLERHHEGLTAGVHHGLGELMGARTDPGQDLQAHRRPRLGAGVPPDGERGAHGRQQDLRIRMRIGDAQLRSVRGDLAARPVVGAGLVELEPLAAQRLERGEPVGSGGLAVRLRVLGVRGPVRAGADRLQRPVEGRAVLLDQLRCGHFGGHRRPTPRRAGRRVDRGWVRTGQQS